MDYSDLPIARIETDNAVLRKIATPVENILSDQTQDLINQLIYTCNIAHGMGIAAPQAFHSKQIFIMSSHPNKRYPNAPTMEAIVVINPEIIWMSDDENTDWEGCLSVPGLRGRVPRATSIKVIYFNQHAEKIETSYQNFLARLFLHEYDHLNGILFIDHVLSKTDMISEQAYQEII